LQENPLSNSCCGVVVRFDEKALAATAGFRTCAFGGVAGLLISTAWGWVAVVLWDCIIAAARLICIGPMQREEEKIGLT